jgi:probable F420-dependent oxidoreductase
MNVGAVFPQSEIDRRPETAAAFARAVEDRGYDVLLAYDHVLGANPDDPAFEGPYDNDDLFHEPLTLFAYLAGVTETLHLATSVLVLPQRQTALVAKQAAEVDVLSDGRLRLGVGIGWNDVEYEALGMEFGTRGRRVEEQVDVLRRLWTEEQVEFTGRWHHLPDVGVNPRPDQQPIPLWMGGDAPPVLRRIGRTADGWLPRGTTPASSLAQVDEQLATIREQARAAGREPGEIDVIPRVRPVGTPPQWIEHVQEWRTLGATHIAVDTIGMELELEAHIEKTAAFYDAMAGAGLVSR